MGKEQEDLDTEKIAALSKEEAFQRMKKVEHKISTLEWDSKMNQIHPFHLYQLKMLREEHKLLKGCCESLPAF